MKSLDGMRSLSIEWKEGARQINPDRLDGLLPNQFQ